MHRQNLNEGKQSTVCMISIWCSGLKTNMQTSYLHISMVIPLPFKAAENKDRIGFLKSTCLISPPFWERKRCISTETLAPKTYQNSLGVNSSSSFISKGWVRWGDRITAVMNPLNSKLYQHLVTTRKIRTGILNFVLESTGTTQSTAVIQFN